MSVLLAAGGLAAVAAGTVAVAGLLAPPRPAELPTVDTVRRPNSDEEWARESTQEFRAIRADLATTAVDEHRSWHGWRKPRNRSERLKLQLRVAQLRRRSGWTDHLAGRLP